MADMPPPPGSPGGPPPGYPGGPPPGYPPAPASAGPKLTVNWVGVVLAISGVIAAIGTFLQFEKVSGAGGSYAFTGLGSETATGAVNADLFEPGGAGKVILALAVLVLVGGVLIVVRQGRLWVSIVTLVLSALGLILGLAAIGAVSNDADDLMRQANGAAITGSVGIGAVLATVGMALGLVFSIVGIVVRRRTS